MSKRSLIVLLLGTGVVVVVVLGVRSLFSLTHVPANTTSSVSSSSAPPSLNDAHCLGEDESADFPSSEKSNTFYNWPSSSTIDVYVKNKTTDETLSTFKIKNLDYENVHPLEFHQCAVYTLREFGTNSLPGYRVELWKYDYAGNGKKLFDMLVEGATSTTNYYEPEFRIDPNEKYLALDTRQDAFVIFDPKTLQILFTLPISDIEKQEPNIIGFVQFYPGGWSTDGRYFWFDFDAFADIIGFVRIDTSNWSYQAFAAPPTTMGGDAFNPDNGIVTYRTNAAPWTADAAIDQQYRDQAKQSGQITSFYLYDLLTKQNYLVATTTDPTYYYRPQWLSSSTLEYRLPSGATTTYTIK